MNAYTHIPTLSELRRMSDRELLEYAEAAGNDDAAWDEINDRNADRQFGADDDFRFAEVA